MPHQLSTIQTSAQAGTGKHGSRWGDRKMGPNVDNSQPIQGEEPDRDYRRDALVKSPPPALDLHGGRAIDERALRPR
jgi:hypothetical protein